MEESRVLFMTFTSRMIPSTTDEQRAALMNEENEVEKGAHLFRDLAVLGLRWWGPCLAWLNDVLESSS